MFSTDLRRLLVLLIALSITALLSGCGDVVKISNGSGNEVGLLVDGTNDSGHLNDKTYVTSGSSVNVGSLTSSGSSNEVLGFTNARPPAYLATPWTNNNETMDLHFESTIRIPITVWIVKGPFADQKQHAIEACIRTSTIWYNERMGVDVRSFDVIDATGNPKAANHFAFSNGDAGDASWKPLRDDIGFVAGQLNIYWVDTVEGATGSGWSNFGAQIAMGRNTGDELLSHETGHAFSLRHIDSNANFNAENIMFSSSNVRQFITEGQLFRAHMNPSSILNSVYNARVGQATRNCGTDASSDTCVPIHKRIWPDGSFPAN